MIAVTPKMETMEPISYTKNMTDSVAHVKREYNTKSTVAVIAFIFLIPQESAITSPSSIRIRG